MLWVAGGVRGREIGHQNEQCGVYFPGRSGAAGGE